MSILSFHDQQHIARMFAQQQNVRMLFEMFINSVSPDLKRWKDSGRDSAWIRNANIESIIDRKLLELNTEIDKLIRSGALSAWNLSCDKNDKMVGDYIKDLALNDALKSGLFERNYEAFTTFIDRTDNGMNLSGRISSLDLKTQLEFYLKSGIATGRSATSISQDIRQLMQEPDKRFRRIRNEKGVLVESQPMKNYHPGQGVYKSSYKNAVRIAASETNMSYRMADSERWKQLDFVLGFEVKRSRNHAPCDICDPLVGQYPKDFVFPGWHPFCICVATPILMSQNDSADYFLNKYAANKYKPANYQQPKYITKIPASASAFMEANTKLVEKSYWGSKNTAFLR